MQSLYVPLTPEARARLRELAETERRSPRQQAAILLEQALGVVAATRQRRPSERSER